MERIQEKDTNSNQRRITAKHVHNTVLQDNIIEKCSSPEAFSFEVAGVIQTLWPEKISSLFMNSLIGETSSLDRCVRLLNYLSLYIEENGRKNHISWLKSQHDVNKNA